MASGSREVRLAQLEDDIRRLDEEVKRETGLMLPLENQNNNSDENPSHHNSKSTPSDVIAPVTIQTVGEMSVSALRGRVLALSEEVVAKEQERDRLLQLMESCYRRMDRFRELRRRLKDGGTVAALAALGASHSSGSGSNSNIHSSSNNNNNNAHDSNSSQQQQQNVINQLQQQLAATSATIRRKDDQIADLERSLKDSTAKLETQRAHMKAIRDGSLSKMMALQEQVAKIQKEAVESVATANAAAAAAAAAGGGGAGGASVRDLEEMRLETSRLRDALEQSRHAEISIRDDLRELCAAGLHILDNLHLSDMVSRQNVDGLRRQLQHAQQMASDLSQRRVNEIVNENRMLWQEIHSLRQELREQQQRREAAAAVVHQHLASTAPPVVLPSDNLPSASSSSSNNNNNYLQDNSNNNLAANHSGRYFSSNTYPPRSDSSLGMDANSNIVNNNNNNNNSSGGALMPAAPRRVSSMGRADLGGENDLYSDGINRGSLRGGTAPGAGGVLRGSGGGTINAPSTTTNTNNNANNNYYSSSQQQQPIGGDYSDRGSWRSAGVVGGASSLGSVAMATASSYVTGAGGLVRGWNDGGVGSLPSSNLRL